MCGIAGKLSLDMREPVHPALVQRMTDVISHRGPDGSGQYVSGPVGLGHRRLSIIDLSTGAQPLANEDKTVWIVYNGEVYNYRALREDLVSRGHVFRTTTDTEVIVHLYEELGQECVTRLRGMFAFAIWDGRNRRLFLARDRVGIKPLYYTVTEKAVLFASEIKSLLVDPSVRAEIDPLAVDRFLTYSYLPGSGTLFENIFKLDPGHSLTIENGCITKRQYWDLRYPAQPRWRRFEEAVEALQELLRHSVRDHLISDVPVGVLLSGGVDSTGVLRYASEESAGPISTFTVGFPGEPFADERPYAYLASQRYGAVHQDITMTARDFGDFLPGYTWHMEEPVYEPPAVALYYVARLARAASVKVLLSGEGGDEAFGGYQTYRNLLALETLKSAFGPAAGLLRGMLHALARSGMGRAERYSPLADMPVSQYYLSRTATPFTGFNCIKPGLYTPEFADRLRGSMAHEPTEKLFHAVRGLPLLHQLLHVDTKTWLPDDLLVKADKMTMAASVELRVPLLDVRILEFAASLPPHFKVRGLQTKRILKQALKDSVPSSILKRKKTGFPVPYGRWLRTELKDLVHDTLLDRAAASARYFRGEALTRLLESHGRGEGGDQEVFSLLVLELLHRQFVQNRPALVREAPAPVPASLLTSAPV